MNSYLQEVEWMVERTETVIQDKEKRTEGRRWARGIVVAGSKRRPAISGVWLYLPCGLPNLVL